MPIQANRGASHRADVRLVRRVSPGIPRRSPEPKRRGCDRSSHHFSPHQTFVLTTNGQPSRTYTRITQARSDGNNARGWGGMHYPSTVEISDHLGEAIAKYVNANSMKRLGPMER